MENNEELNSIREALKVSPDNVPLLKMFAKLCLKHWSLGEGKQTFEILLTKLPNDLEAQLGLVQVLYQMGNLSEAGVRLEGLLSEHPNSAEVWLYSAKIKIGENDLKAAGEDYNKARSLDQNLQDGAVEKELKEAGLRIDKRREDGKIAALNTNVGWVPQSEEEDEDDEEDDYPGPNLMESTQEVERPKVAFSDVGGMEDVKEEIRLKIIYPLNNPDIYKAYGKKVGGGVLLYGPPGCGKTFVSRATAGEIKANFISIGLHQILDMYIGNSEKNLHEIFELARANTPSVLFIDEIDALAANRTDMRHSASRTLINQFLAEMDGDAAHNEGVLILGATNAPWYIDPAFRRPGRFDRIIFVPTPDEQARVEIIQILAKDKPVSHLDAQAVAKKTKDFSGADLKALFDQATESSLTKAMKENRVIPITTHDLIKQVKAIVPSSKAWFESAKNYALYSNQSGLYNPILRYLGIKND